MRLCVGPGAVTTLPLAASVPSHALQAMQMTSRHAILDRPTLWDSLRDAMEIPNRSVGGLTISRPLLRHRRRRKHRSLIRHENYPAHARRSIVNPAIPLSRYPAIPLSRYPAGAGFGALPLWR